MSSFANNQWGDGEQSVQERSVVLHRWKYIGILLVGAVIACVIGVRFQSWRKVSDGTNRPDEIPLFQPGSPWADKPETFPTPAHFERDARRPVRRDYFQVLHYPPFVHADEAEDLVESHLPVLGVVYKGRAKAYPIRVLGLHEICNDSIADEPIVASY